MARISWELKLAREMKLVVVVEARRVAKEGERDADLIEARIDEVEAISQMPVVMLCVVMVLHHAAMGVVTEMSQAAEVLVVEVLVELERETLMVRVEGVGAEEGEEDHVEDVVVVVVVAGGLHAEESAEATILLATARL